MAFLRDKISVIHHGVHDVPFVDSNFYKEKFNVEGLTVLLTFGLLSPNKGIETALEALPDVVEKYPDTVYIILGATHPEVKKVHGEQYRLSLERKAMDLNIADNVVFQNRFVDLQELTEYMSCCDIYLTPYLAKEQITSGTLAYAVGMGKAVVSTPYWYAEELLVGFTGSAGRFRRREGYGQGPERLDRRFGTAEQDAEGGLRVRTHNGVARGGASVCGNVSANARRAEELGGKVCLEAKDASPDYSPGDQARSFDVFVGRCRSVATRMLRYTGS